MSDWQRRSVRTGAVKDDGPYDGVPAHLQAPLQEWLRTRFGWHRPSNKGGIDTALIHTIASACRISVVISFQEVRVSNSLIAACHDDEDVFLDVLDATLFIKKGEGASVLRDIFVTGNSVWTVSESGIALERRVDDIAIKAKKDLTSGGSLAATEISESWKRVFSRDADPSDAWDHAAKAIEAALIPIVVPTQDKPHLGHVLGRLRSQPDKWQLVLPGVNNDYSVQPLIGMLDLIWPNPDRHASETRRIPTPDEAQAVLHLAITIVQWAASGALHLRN